MYQLRQNLKQSVISLPESPEVQTVFKMKRFPAPLFFLLLFFFTLASCSKRSGNPRVLVFAKTAGFHHESIKDGMAAIRKLGSANKFEVDTTTNAAWFQE